MGTMDMPAAGAPAYASSRGARSESGRSTYSRRSRSARAAAAADENLPASRFIYVEASYGKYCEALAWAKDQVRCRRREGPPDILTQFGKSHPLPEPSVELKRGWLFLARLPTTPLRAFDLPN